MSPWVVLVLLIGLNHTAKNLLGMMQFYIVLATALAVHECNSICGIVWDHYCRQDATSQGAVRVDLNLMVGIKGAPIREGHGNVAWQ